jgi:hypothetical protein
MYMSTGMIIYMIILFVLLTPSILFRFPKKGNKWTVAFVHGILFAIIFRLTHKMVHTFNHKKEHFTVYSDSICNNIVESPIKTIPLDDKKGLYFKDKDHCSGPHTIGDLIKYNFLKN